jgi:hypothetical protein
VARVLPIRRGWVVRDEVPGPDVDEFADADRVIAALARPGARPSLLAVQHPHRTPGALAAGLSLDDALPAARSTLAVLLRTAYRPIENVVAPYLVDGPDGHAIGLLCMVDPAHGQHIEEVYPDVVAERARVLAGLGALTSAAMLIPVEHGDALTAAVRGMITGPPEVSTVDSSGRRHRLWLCAAQDGLLDAVGAAGLLVADGNHRVAAAGAAGLSGLLALVTAGPDVRVGAFHRAITGTGLDAGTLREAWWRAGLEVRGVAPDAQPRRGLVVVRCPAATLTVQLPRTGAIDHEVVENLMLDKALGLDPEGPAVRPLPAGRPWPDRADAVIELAPVPLADVLAVYAAGGRMPRKSTYFTPKPRSGLLIADLLHSSND